MDQNKSSGKAMERLTSCVWGAVAIAATSAFATDAHAACAGEEASCEVRTGSYDVIVPDNASTARPAVLFLHGYGGTGAGVLKNSGMVTALQERGYVVIAPNGVPRSANGAPSWNFYPGWDGRDEVGFFKEILEDASKRFNVDPEQSILAGFSAGAFMVNYLACEAPDTFAAYAPVAGGFWRPQPASCDGPIRLHHTHGWSDSVVPLEGRYLRNGTWQQGDIYAGLELWRDTLGCATHAPNRSWSSDENLLRRWDCGEGAEITFSIHPGGHTIPTGWAEAVTTWFEKAEPSQ